MTANQLRTALGRLGMTQVGLARVLGAGDRSVRHWVLDERPIPESVAILVRLMLAGKITADDIQSARR